MVWSKESIRWTKSVNRRINLRKYISAFSSADQTGWKCAWITNWSLEKQIMKSINAVPVQRKAEHTLKSITIHLKMPAWTNVFCLLELQTRQGSFACSGQIPAGIPGDGGCLLIQLPEPAVLRDHEGVGTHRADATSCRQPGLLLAFLKLCLVLCLNLQCNHSHLAGADPGLHRRKKLKWETELFSSLVLRGRF